MKRGDFIFAVVGCVAGFRLDRELGHGRKTDLTWVKEAVNRAGDLYDAVDVACAEAPSEVVDDLAKSLLEDGVQPDLETAERAARDVLNGTYKGGPNAAEATEDLWTLDPSTIPGSVPVPPGEQKKKRGRPKKVTTPDVT